MTPLPARLVAALADRYRIERELGAGGMATVFLAEDLRHHRKVALKVLLPELAAVIGAERILHEIATTAALQHPHILPLFDSGEADGFLFYVMPFIDGQTLRERTAGRFLTPSIRELLWTPARTPAGDPLPYGLGWFLGERDGRRLAWHTGLWEERYSALYLKVLSDRPSEQLTLILLANSDALQWQTGFGEAAIERSAFATAFLRAFPAR